MSPLDGWAGIMAGLVIGLPVLAVIVAVRTGRRDREARARDLAYRRARRLAGVDRAPAR